MAVAAFLPAHHHVVPVTRARAALVPRARRWFPCVVRRATLPAAVVPADASLVLGYGGQVAYEWSAADRDSVTHHVAAFIAAAQACQYISAASAAAARAQLAGFGSGGLDVVVTDRWMLAALLNWPHGAPLWLAALARAVA